SPPLIDSRRIQCRAGDSLNLDFSSKDAVFIILLRFTCARGRFFTREKLGECLEHSHVAEETAEKKEWHRADSAFESGFERTQNHVGARWVKEMSNTDAFVHTPPLRDEKCVSDPIPYPARSKPFEGEALFFIHDRAAATDLKAVFAPTLANVS